MQAVEPSRHPTRETELPETTIPPTRAGPRRVFGLLGVMTIALILIAVVLLGSWALASHWICEEVGQVALLQAAVPAILVNSPYHGFANGTGVLAANFPGGPGYPTHGGIYGIGGPNGTANGAFFAVNLSVRSLQNSSELGFGESSRCTGPFAIVPEPPTRGSSGPWPIAVASNMSDQGEATTVNLSGFFSGNPTVPEWNNGFTWSNSPNVATCGMPGRTLNISSVGLDVSVPATVGGVHWIIPFTLPFKETYQYTFPTNGTWAVDNLSEPGGPRGGWAFDYLGACV